jgi:hypothetical protein
VEKVLIRFRVKADDKERGRSKGVIYELASPALIPKIAISAVSLPL